MTPLHSMTGFAAASANLEHGSISLELRAVNSRYLDLSFRMGDDFRPLEPVIRARIGERVQRGKLECRLYFSAKEATHLPGAPDAAMLQRLADLSTQVRQAMPEARPMGVGEVLRWPGVLTDTAASPEALQAAALALVDGVIRDFNQSRAQEGTKLAKVIMGTGPYKLDHWTPDVEWVLTAKEDYWRQEGDAIWEGGPSGPAKVKRIVHKTVTEWGTRFAMLQTGDAAWVDVPLTNRSQADAWVGESCDAYTGECVPVGDGSGPLRVWPKLVYPGRTDIFLNFNVKTGESGSNAYIGSGQLDGNGIPPDFFSDIHMRKAFSYCFDYDTYIEEGQNGDGVRNNGVIITNMLGYNPDQEMYMFDMDKCKEELELAWDGQVAEKGFRVQGVTGTGYTMNMTALAILQSNLRTIDPKYQIEIVTLPWPSYLAAFRAGLLPIAVSGWQEDYHDPHNWVQPFLIGTYANRTNVPEEFRAIFRPLIEQAVVEPDADKRAELYYEVAKLRFENVPQVNLSQDGERHYEQRWVKNFFWNPVLGYRYFYAYDLAGNE